VLEVQEFSMSSLSKKPPLTAAFHEYYGSGIEEGRLQRGKGRLEFARTKMIIRQNLPPAPAVIVDAASGPGDYSCWLARQGYEVHLTDVVPLHIAQAIRNSASQPDSPIGSAAVGDARSLRHQSKFASAIILFGPLYHLTAREDRIQCLCECRRVLKPGGLIFASAICRYSSLLTGLKKSFYDDPAYEAIIQKDLNSGQHSNPTQNPEYFTTAYYHRPHDMLEEFQTAGLIHHHTHGVEGPAWLLQDLDKRWADPGHRLKILKWTSIVARDPAMVAVIPAFIDFNRRMPNSG
jgi:SAM-dependent methyltransferase